MATDSLAIAHTEASMGWGGQEIRILSEAAGFLRRGHRVELLAAQGARILEEAPRFGVTARALPIGRKTLPALRAMSAALARGGFDIVNTHSSTDSWLAAVALRGMKLAGGRPPALVRTRHVAVEVSRDFATRWLYRSATTRIVTTGRVLRDRLVDNLGVDPERIESIPTGIDPARFVGLERQAARAALGLDTGAKLVGIVATLRSWKGHADLIDAVGHLAHPGTLLIIVGDGPQRRELVDRVAMRGVGDRVRFVGQQHDVAPWLAALDVFVLPSHANEGVPQALLQAMFARVPAVTTLAGAIGEIARDGETATIVPVRDPSRLARGIDHVLGDPAGAARRAEKAHALVMAEHTERIMLDRMERVFRAARQDVLRGAGLRSNASARR